MMGASTLLASFVFTIILHTGSSQNYGKLVGEFLRQGSPATSHEVGGTVYAIDSTKLWFIGFTYDGLAPDAFVYAGTSVTPNDQGIFIPDEQGRTDKIGAYRNQNIILTLPIGTEISDLKWISVWCRSFNAHFGTVTVPSNFEAPSTLRLGMLGFRRPVHGVSAEDVIILNSRQIRIVNLDYDGAGPAAYFWAGLGEPNTQGFRVPDKDGRTDRKLPRFSGDTMTITLQEGKTVADIDYIGLWCELATQDFGHVLIPDNPNVPPYIIGSDSSSAYENCEVLVDDEFQVAWTVDRELNKIEIQLRGKVSLNGYMAFGISGSESQTTMVGSDVAVVWIDPETLKGNAVDYNLGDYSQCETNNGNGACPDTFVAGLDDDITLIGTLLSDGVTMITYERDLNADESGDKNYPLDGSVYISWALGSINPNGQVAKHTTRTPGNLQINFGRDSSICPPFKPTLVVSDVDPWQIEPLKPEGSATFVAQIGPSGGERGYEGIVKQIGWGFAWYIDNRVIPEIYVKRNVTYKFMVRGGDDGSNSASYHPFYITDSKDGGYNQKTAAEKQKETIYAGPVSGTYCEWKGTMDPDDYDTFDKYFATLSQECASDSVEEGILEWTPDENTPDVLYYQCYIHRYFGWKIILSEATSTARGASLYAILLWAFLILHLY